MNHCVVRWEFTTAQILWTTPYLVTLTAIARGFEAEVFTDWNVHHGAQSTASKH